MSILVLNAGSSTLKFSLFDDAAGREQAGGIVRWRGGGETSHLTLRSEASGERRATAELADYGDAARWILRELRRDGPGESLRAVGNRVVHGGVEFQQATLIDGGVRRSLQALSELAPLHNPPALAAMEAIAETAPEASQVAVFDTAFFAALPPRAFIYPVPYAWYVQYGIRRFGFHGISHAYCASRAAEMLGREADASLRLVICHLGSGCSATATRGGRPVATTMGFTPLEGLMMGTRSGSIDPGVLLYLVQQHGFTVERLGDALNHQSGLLGVSDISSDYRDVERAADAGDERARLAIEIFSDRVRSTVGALAVTLGGVDALVFTGGIGEHSRSLRRLAIDGLQCLGLRCDEEPDGGSHEPDRDIASCESSGRILVIRTREQLMIARETKQLIDG